MSGRGLWLVLGALGLGLIILIVNDDSGTVLGLSSDGFARLLYLGVLGAVLGAGILGSGIGLGNAARSIAIWLGVIMLLVGGYQYRYELQDIASRVTAGLVPGSPLSISDSDGRSAVMIDRMSSGHFEVRASLNGTLVNFLIDTGASGTVLSAADASRIGFDPDALSYDVPVMTANGLAHAARVTADEIRVGDIVRSRVPVLVAQAGRLEQSLLGMNFIGTLSGFDMRGERLILRD